MMSDKNLLQETYEVSTFDKVLLDEIHSILDKGFDVNIKRDPTVNHLTVKPFIDPDSIYNNLLKDIMYRVCKEEKNNFVVMINPDERKYCTQPLDKFIEELLDIKMIAKDLMDRIEKIKDRFDPV